MREKKFAKCAIKEILCQKVVVVVAAAAAIAAGIFIFNEEKVVQGG